MENEHLLQHQQQIYFQQAHSRAATRPISRSSSSSSSSNSRGMQQQHTAVASSSRKHQQSEVRSILYAARHPLEAAPSFFRCPLHPGPSRTTKIKQKNQTKLLFHNLAGQTDLASFSLRISVTTRPAAQFHLHSKDQGKLQP